MGAIEGMKEKKGSKRLKREVVKHLM